MRSAEQSIQAIAELSGSARAARVDLSWASLHCHADESACRANVGGQVDQLNRKSLRTCAQYPCGARPGPVAGHHAHTAAPESGRFPEREPARPVKRLEHGRVVGRVEALTGSQAVGRLFPLACRIAGSRVRRHYLKHEYNAEKRGAWRLLGAEIEGVLGQPGPAPTLPPLSAAGRPSKAGTVGLPALIERHKVLSASATRRPR